MASYAAYFRRKLNLTWLQMKRSKVSYLMIAPYVLLFFLFTVLPVVTSMALSTTYFNLLEPPRFIGWQNYQRLFLEDDVFLIAVKNTFLFAAVTGPVSYMACFIFAWFINELSSRMRAFMTLLFYAPSISGNVYMMWQLMFSGDSYGYINGMLLKYGFISEPILFLKEPQYILPIIILVQLWLSLGTSFLAFIAGLQVVDKSLYEAAAVDGIRNRWQELWFITLPAMRSYLMFGAVVQITQSFAVSSVAVAMVGFPSTDYAGHTIMTHLMDYGSIRFDMGYASSIATILFLVMIGSNKLVQRFLRTLGD